jgi:hypothetical protein
MKSLAYIFNTFLTLSLILLGLSITVGQSPITTGTPSLIYNQNIIIIQPNKF